MWKKYWKTAATVLLTLICLAFGAMLFVAWLHGEFDSVETLQAYIARFGAFGPLVLGGIQMTQVLIPFLPGFLGCAAGPILFGVAGGFWCNYIAISLGSIIAFFLAKKLGTPFVKSLFPEEKYEKWSNWAATSKSYTVLLFLGILLPLFPDDFFCYFSGLTKMSPRRFIWIIILGKPWCILAYTLGFSLIK